MHFDNFFSEGLRDVGLHSGADPRGEGATGPPPPPPPPEKKGKERKEKERKGKERKGKEKGSKKG